MNLIVYVSIIGFIPIIVEVGNSWFFNLLLFMPQLDIFSYIDNICSTFYSFFLLFVLMFSFLFLPLLFMFRLVSYKNLHMISSYFVLLSVIFVSRPILIYLCF